MFGALVERRLVQDPGWNLWANGEPFGSTNTDSGVTVTNDTALKLLAVYGSVSFISDLLGQLPTDHYREVGETRSEVKPKAAWLDTPNPELTGQDYITQFMASLLWEGNSYTIVLRNALGQVAELWPQHPMNVQVYRDRPGTPIEYYVNGQRYPGEILHVRAFTLPGAIVGCNPITYAREAIGSGLAQQTAGASFYANGSTPSMVIEAPGGPESVDAGTLKAGIDKYHQGAAKSHGTLVLTGGATAKTLTISPQDAQFLEGRNFSAAEITTGLYRIPSENLGYVMQGGSAVTYMNLEQRWTELRRRCFGTWITKYERAMTSLTPRPQYVKLNDSAYLRADEKTQYETMGIGIDKGFLLPNEAREKLDMEPLPGGDQFPQPAAPAPVRESFTVNMPAHPDVNVSTPDVRVPITVQPAQVTVEAAKAPDVHVEAPQVRVDAPVVHVAAAEAPEVRVDVAAPPAANVTVNVPEPKPRKKKVIRDREQRIVGIEE